MAIMMTDDGGGLAAQLDLLPRRQAALDERVIPAIARLLDDVRTQGTALIPGVHGSWWHSPSRVEYAGGLVELRARVLELEERLSAAHRDAITERAAIEREIEAIAAWSAARVSS
ncbi:hypothetical protein [Agromyces atrinae]|uniref:Uncharacterized protein n=1 Tax=Agromyces atrinae TaxID=592376 RepID=A0A4Q2M6X1_9MICO|nr:hypothetical protein [Agromyces atrinae]NYD67864.1 hypothetical protein [Agromyces atrinae]RXZ87964.1 hypothetical protein ESP50_01855 [Agromyces atrinae]